MPHDAAVARVRGMLGALLSEERLAEMAAAPDMESLDRLLSGSPCGRWRRGPHARDWEAALRQDLEDALVRLRALGGAAWAAVVDVLLAPCDVANLQTVLRALAVHASLQDVLAATLPTARFGHSLLLELARAGSVRHALDLLGTWGEPWALALRRDLPREVYDAVDLERRLRRAYHAAALGRLPRSARADARLMAFLGDVADAANVPAAMKRPPGDDAYLAGGLPLRAWRRLRAGEPPPLAGLARVVARAGDVEDAELAARHELLRRAERLLLADPLGYGPLAAYVHRKTAEVARLRAMLRRLAGDLPDSGLARRVARGGVA